MTGTTAESSVEGFIASLNYRMLSAISMPPFHLGPEPLRCPACGMTRTACLRLFGHDRYHEERIRKALADIPASRPPREGKHP